MRPDLKKLKRWLALRVSPLAKYERALVALGHASIQYILVVAIFATFATFVYPMRGLVRQAREGLEKL